MKSYTKKVAVITGGSSGIGRALAVALSKEGAKIVLADINETGMEETAKSCAAEPRRALRRLQRRVQDNLADQTYRRFGAAHLVFNNAGVAVAGPTWTATLEDWKWSLDINLMGVVHGIRPSCRACWKRRPKGTSSTRLPSRGCSLHGSSVYCATKHAVVTMSECLHQDLRVATRRSASACCARRS